MLKTFVICKYVNRKTTYAGKITVRTCHFYDKFGRAICWIWIYMQEKNNYFTCEGAAVAECLSSWLAKQEVRGSIPRLATWISEIGYLPLPSRNMAEIPLEQRKSSIQPTNTTNQCVKEKWMLIMKYFSKRNALKKPSERKILIFS